MARGLGKGLGALFGDDVVSNVTTSTAPVKEENKDYKFVDIKKIKPNPKQARKRFDETEIEELAQSIKVHGVIQPILLTAQGNGYTIIAGERRFKAAIKAGLNEIPAIVKEYTEQQLMEISLVENLQRVDLNPIEEARGIKDLIDKCNLTQEEAADKIGKNRSSVANIIRILTLPNEVITLIEEGKISKGHAKCLLGVEDSETQIYLANEIVEKGISVRNLEKIIKDLKPGDTKKDGKEDKGEKKVIPEIADFETKLQDLFCTKVKITGNEHKGSIKIDYYSLEELNQIYDIILKK